jgi:Na+-driven multidrug efflux pump
MPRPSVARRNSYTTSPGNLSRKAFLLAEQHNHSHHHHRNESDDEDNDDDDDDNDDEDTNDHPMKEKNALVDVEQLQPLVKRHDHSEDDDKSSDYDETEAIVKLSIQGIISQLGWSVPSFLLASYIGRQYGPIYLDGYSLAMLAGNLCILSVLESVFDAVTTLIPQAFGSKNYVELQMITIRGFILCIIVVSFFVIVLSLSMKHVLILVGEDNDAAQYAQDWYRIYSLSLPFYVLYHMTNCFLAAQYIIMPEVITAIVSAIGILPILVLFFGAAYGYIGTSISVVVYQAIQAFLLIMYLVWKKPYRKETWQYSILDKECIRQVFKWKQFSNLLWLSSGAMLAGYVLVAHKLGYFLNFVLCFFHLATIVLLKLPSVVLFLLMATM